MVSLSVTIQNLKTFKGLDKSLFERFYLGYPYCLEKAGSFLLEAEDLKQALAELKALGKESYLVTPPIMQIDDFNLIERIIDEVVGYGLDGIEINDVGWFAVAKKWPSLKITAGHFTNIYHPEAALEYIREGAQTIISNSELTFDEIKEIAEKVSSQEKKTGTVPRPSKWGLSPNVEIAVYGNLPLGFAYDCFLRKIDREDKCRQQCTKPYILANDGVTMANVGRANITAADFCLAEQIEKIKRIDADFWRLEMYQDPAEKINKVGQIFKRCIDEREGSEYISKLEELAEQGLCNGWFFGKSGHEYIRKLSMYNYQSTIANLTSEIEH